MGKYELSFTGKTTFFIGGTQLNSMSPRHTGFSNIHCLFPRSCLCRDGLESSKQVWRGDYRTTPFNSMLGKLVVISVWTGLGRSPCLPGPARQHSCSSSSTSSPLYSLCPLTSSTTTRIMKFWALLALAASVAVQAFPLEDYKAQLHTRDGDVKKHLGYRVVSKVCSPFHSTLYSILYSIPHPP